jgi:hypothetical protein
MDHIHITPAFTARLNQIANEKNFRIDKSFVDWYLRTKFDTRCCKIHLTDGASDGEIDGIVFEGDVVYIVQSKFSENILKGRNATPLSIGDYAKFDKTISSFENKDNFDEYLKTVESSLHSLYKKVFEVYQNNPDLVVWEITTLHKSSPAGERRVINRDKINYHYYDYNLRLFELSMEGATPLAKPLDLNFTENPFITEDANTGIKSYIVQVFLKDFIEYTDNDPYFTIISRNVRNDLHSDINDSIKQTYLDHPEEFWYSHNGMTIICERATIKGKKFLLVGPNIINGAQTIHSVKGLSRRDPKAKVLVKIIEIPPQANIPKKFIDNIILRTNQQNKMYTYDLKANDPLQVSLASKFLEFKIFYDRRRGDWDLNKRIYRNEGLERLQSKELAQILVACRPDLGGVLTAKENIEALFTDKYFEKIFSTPFDEILLKYYLFYLVKDSIHDIKNRKPTRREKNIAVFTCFAIVWESIETHNQISRWCTAHKLNPNMLYYKNRKSKMFQRVMRDLFYDCWNKFLSESRKIETLRPSDFFNKSKKWNTDMRKKFIPRYRHKIIKSMQRILD